MSGAGEVVTLAVAPVDLPELGLVAEALVAAALAPPAAHLLALRLATGAQVRAARLALLTLAASAQVPRLTVTRPAVIGTCRGQNTLYSLIAFRIIQLHNFCF